MCTLGKASSLSCAAVLFVRRNFAFEVGVACFPKLAQTCLSDKGRKPQHRESRKRVI